MVEKPESISAFFPAFNDAGTIVGLVEKTYRVLSSLERDFEIVVVDDGSTDQTAQLLQQLEAKYGNILRVIRHPANEGYGATLRSGFAAASKDFLFYTDGDGQYDPGEFPLLLEHLKPHIGLVNGYKIKRQDPWHRIVLGKIYATSVQILFQLHLRDVNCDFRLIRRSWLTRISLHSQSGAICVELIRELGRLGCPMVEVPVHHYPRAIGRSQFFHLRPVLNVLWELAGLYIRKRPQNNLARCEGYK